MIFFEEDDAIETEPPRSLGRYVATNVGAFSLIVSVGVAAIVLAVLGLAYAGSRLPDASLWAWISFFNGGY